MSDEEPTLEEVLASIRRIIDGTDDDDDAPDIVDAELDALVAGQVLRKRRPSYWTLSSGAWLTTSWGHA